MLLKDLVKKQLPFSPLALSYWNDYQHQQINFVMKEATAMQ